MPTLHIHVDESGDFSFNSRGSKYYVIAVAWTYDPGPLAGRVSDLRFGHLRAGRDIERFHACVDSWGTKFPVLEEIARCHDWNFVATVVQKNKVYSSLRVPQKFYPRFAAMPIRFVLRGRMRSDTNRVLIYTDTLAIQQNRRAVEKAIKKECAEDLESVPWSIYHHSSRSNTWLQIVDYACWAVQRKWEHGDARPYELIKGRLAAPEHDVLAVGTAEYY